MSHQLELQLSPEALFNRFRDRVWDNIRQGGISAALSYELRTWEEAYDLPLVASWVRRILRESVIELASPVLEGFGRTFRGDEVGHLGRDLLTSSLHHHNIFLRTAATNVLVEWLEYDEDGMWLEMAENRLELEENMGLQLELQTAVNAQLELHAREDVQEPNALLEEFLEVRRGCELEMKGTAPLARVGPFLAEMINMPHHLMASVMEMLNPGLDINELAPDWVLGIYATHQPNTEFRHLRIWDPEGAFAFSLEPTASPGRVLMFCYLQ